MRAYIFDILLSTYIKPLIYSHEQSAVYNGFTIPWNGFTPQARGGAMPKENGKTH